MRAPLVRRASSRPDRRHERIAVGSAFVLLSIAFVPVISFGALYPRLLSVNPSLGHGLAAVTVVTFWLVTGATSPFVGLLLKYLAFSTMVGAGATIMVAGVTLAAFRGTQLAIVLGLGALGGAGSAALGSVTNFAAVFRFVDEPARRTVAVAIAAAGMGASSLVLEPLAYVLHATTGVRGGLIFLATWIILLSAPCVGAYLYLEHRAAPNLPRRRFSASDNQDDAEWTRRGAARTAMFRWLFLAAVAAPAAFQVMIVHQVEMVREFSGSYRAGVAAATIMGLASIVVRLGSSPAVRHIGHAATYASCVAISLLGLVILRSPWPHLGWPWRAYCYGVLFSAAYGAFAPMFPAASLRLFGRRSFAAIHGILYGALGVGAALGAWLGGWLRDVSGSYSSAVLFVAGALVLSAVAYGLAESRQDPGNQKSVVRAALGGPECNTN